MKISEEKKREILEKKEILNEAKINLKKEFVGIDDVIDELMDDIQSWYLFPEGQIRPTIINLWGLTGVGKTSLVQEMFKHINMDDIIYKFNVGDYAGQGDSSLSYVFSSDLKDKENKPVAVMFDEFQLGRTIDEHGAEVQKSGLRVIWDLLDSGKIEHMDYSWSGGEVMKYIYRLEKCLNEGVEIEKGIITSKLNKFKDRGLT
jgi:cell division protease FtsH